MGHDLNDMEYDILFSKTIREFRFCTEEITKMLECRLDSLTNYIREVESDSPGYKSARTEIVKSIEGLEFFYQSVIEKLKRNMEKAFDKLESEK